MSNARNDPQWPDLQQYQQAIGQIMEQTQALMQRFIQHQTTENALAYNVLDLGVISRTFQQFAERMAQDPAKVIDAQLAMWQDFLDLSIQATSKHPEPPPDKRFKDEAWNENPVFSYIKQSYLLASKHIYASLAHAQQLDEHTQKKLDFYTRQFVDAMAPTNFAATNPQVLRETIASNGENLLNGLKNLLADLEAGKGKLKIRMTDTDKFELGVNVGVTPGKVVFQNDLIQLLQYTPTTEKVAKRPLLILPPWINKFYILDLRPSNSYIKWAVDQGHTVFVISWVNPDETLANKSFEHYLLEGAIAALDAIQKITHEPQVNAVGYCLGGTLLAVTLAYLAAKQQDRIASATFLTTMVDFSEPGELGVFIDDEQIALIESQMERKGYFEGRHMADAFNLLRANDLIWGFVVNNYLLGRDPFPFDLLYWNSDSTRMPRAMHQFYLRNMYQKNLLCQTDSLIFDNERINLRNITTPVYILSTRDDHIAPWRSTYAATQLYAGPIKFVLGGSGHIAGVINPPAANKYGFSIGNEYPQCPDAWIAQAQHHEGSWWIDWQNWIRDFANGETAARQPSKSKALEDAPGSYVKVRAE